MKYILFSVFMSGYLSSFAGTPYFSAHCTSPTGTIVKISTGLGCGDERVLIYKQTAKQTSLVYKLEGACDKPFRFVGIVDYQRSILSLTSDQFFVAPGVSEQFALVASPGTIKTKPADEYLRNVNFDADFIRKSTGDKYSVTVEKVTCKAEDFLNHFSTDDWKGFN